MIEFKGSFRRADLAPRGVRSNNYPTSLQMIRRTRCGRDDSFPSHTIGGNDIVSIATHFPYNSFSNKIIDDIDIH